MLILLILVLIFIIGPILYMIVTEDMERTNKKIQDHYKEMEEKRKTEYAAMYTFKKDEDIDDSK